MPRESAGPPHQRDRADIRTTADDIGHRPRQDPIPLRVEVAAVVHVQRPAFRGEGSAQIVERHTFFVEILSRLAKKIVPRLDHRPIGAVRDICFLFLLGREPLRPRVGLIRLQEVQLTDAERLGRSAHLQGRSLPHGHELRQPLRRKVKPPGPGDEIRNLIRRERLKLPCGGGEAAPQARVVPRAKQPRGGGKPPQGSRERRTSEALLRLQIPLLRESPGRPRPVHKGRHGRFEIRVDGRTVVSLKGGLIASRPDAPGRDSDDVLRVAVATMREGTPGVAPHSRTPSRRPAVREALGNATGRSDAPPAPNAGTPRLGQPGVRAAGAGIPQSDSDYLLFRPRVKRHVSFFDHSRKIP